MVVTSVTIIARTVAALVDIQTCKRTNGVDTLKTRRTWRSKTFVDVNAIVCKRSINAFETNFTCILIVTFVDIVTAVGSYRVEARLATWTWIRIFKTFIDFNTRKCSHGIHTVEPRFTDGVDFAFVDVIAIITNFTGTIHNTVEPFITWKCCTEIDHQAVV